LTDSNVMKSAWVMPSLPPAYPVKSDLRTIQNYLCMEPASLSSHLLGLIAGVVKRPGNHRLLHHRDTSALAIGADVGIRIPEG
jgi:hypothetical protein